MRWLGGLGFDTVDYAKGAPPHALVLVYSERHSDLYLATPEYMDDPAPGSGGTEVENVRSEMMFSKRLITAQFFRLALSRGAAACLTRTITTMWCALPPTFFDAFLTAHRFRSIYKIDTRSGCAGGCGKFHLTPAFSSFSLA